MMLPVFVSVWRGRHPSLTQSPYQPFAIGTTLDSVHQVLSHCYNVHARIVNTSSRVMSIPEHHTSSPG